MITRKPPYRPDRYDFACGPRLYSDAMSLAMLEKADESPVDPSFVHCQGDRGHDGMVALGDMASVDCVVLAGEIGGECRITVIPIERWHL